MPDIPARALWACRAAGVEPSDLLWRATEEWLPELELDSCRLADPAPADELELEDPKVTVRAELEDPRPFP